MQERQEEPQVTGTIVVDGHRYPAVLWEGIQVAEAHSYAMCALPHLLPGDLEILRPTGGLSVSRLVEEAANPVAVRALD